MSSSEVNVDRSITRIYRTPVLLTMLALIVVGTAFLVSENSSVFTEDGFASAVTLTGWIAFGLLYVVIVIVLQRYGYRKIWTVLLSLGWGALAATGLAQQANIAFNEIFFRSGVESDITAWTTTPVVEETIKALGVFGLALIPAVRFRGSLDGLFYGVVIGAGFMVVESTVYTLAAVHSSGGNLWGVLLDMIFLRGVIGGLANHPAFTGIIGAGIGYALARGDVSVLRRIAILSLATAFSIGMHSIWNYQENLNLVSLVAGVAAFSALLLALHLARRGEEKRLIRLAPEYFSHGQLTQADVTAIEAEMSKRRRLSNYGKAALKYVRAVDMRGANSHAAIEASKKLQTMRPGSPQSQ